MVAIEPLIDILRSAFPEHNFDGLEELLKIKSSIPQQKMYLTLKKHIPDLQPNYRHPDLYHQRKDARMELDLWSEQYQLAIEYQGQQHFLQVTYIHQLRSL